VYESPALQTATKSASPGIRPASKSQPPTINPFRSSTVRNRICHPRKREPFMCSRSPHVGQVSIPLTGITTTFQHGAQKTEPSKKTLEFKPSPNIKHSGQYPGSKTKQKTKKKISIQDSTRYFPASCIRNAARISTGVASLHRDNPTVWISRYSTPWSVVPLVAADGTRMRCSCVTGASGANTRFKVNGYGCQDEMELGHLGQCGSRHRTQCSTLIAIRTGPKFEQLQRRSQKARVFTPCPTSHNVLHSTNL